MHMLVLANIMILLYQVGSQILGQNALGYHSRYQRSYCLGLEAVLGSTLGWVIRSELRDDLVNGSGHLGDVLGLPALLEDPGNHLQEIFDSLLTFEAAPGSAQGIGGSHF